jgi:hypothetical protein
MPAILEAVQQNLVVMNRMKIQVTSSSSLIRKERAVVDFKVLSMHSSGETYEIQEKSLYDRLLFSPQVTPYVAGTFRKTSIFHVKRSNLNDGLVFKQLPKTAMRFKDKEIAILRT